MLTFGFESLRRLFALSRQAVPGEGVGRAERIPGADLIFRLRAWPDLPERGRTAAIYRMLSVMSQQPVNRQWIVTNSRMAPLELDALLLALVADGSIEVIDPARFATARVPGAAEAAGAAGA